MEIRPPGWRRALATWGASTAAHALAILVLGFLVLASDLEAWRKPKPLESELVTALSDELTTLAVADVAGDPFTTALSDDPPSLTMDPSDIDPEVVNLPMLPPRALFGPEVRDRNGEAAAIPTDATTGTAAGPTTVPFSGRHGPTRAMLVRREGGSAASEAAVTRGLDWLARHQRRDGSWSLDTQMVCGAGCPPTRAMTSDTGATGLALLALLGAGHIHTQDGPHQQTVARGLRWLITHQSGEGDLFSGGATTAHLYSHAIATMAISEAYGLSHDPALLKPTRRALGFVSRSQNKFSGGWRYTPTIDGDTSVFGWQMFALRSGQYAGIAPSKNTLRLARIFLDDVAGDPRKSTYVYKPGRTVTPTMTAEALLCRQYLGWDQNHASLQRGVGLIVADLKQSQERNIYYWYYATQLLHNMRGPEWKGWNLRMREGLIADQVSGEGCDRGSWDPVVPDEDAWGARAGRLFQTTLSLLTLEVYYRYLPLFRTNDLELEGSDAPLAEEAEPLAKPIAP